MLVRYLTRVKVADGAKYVSSIVMESLYLGKYFVGNVVTTPLYVEPNNTAKPFTYLQESSLFGVGAEPTRSMVTRILINANEVRNVFKDDKYLKPYSEVKSFGSAEGIKLVHWGTVPGQWEYEAMQIGNNETRLKQLIEVLNQTSRAPITNRFYGYNASMVVSFTPRIWEVQTMMSVVCIATIPTSLCVHTPRRTRVMMVESPSRDSKPSPSNSPYIIL